MARKTIRIDIPTNSPDNLVALSQDVVLKHEEDGESTVLSSVDMAGFKTKVDEAAAKRAEAKRLEAKAQSLNAEAARLLGVSEGQNSQTEGTVYFELLRIRDLLLSVNRGHEDNLATWGFDVVTGSARTGRRAPVSNPEDVVITG